MLAVSRSTKAGLRAAVLGAMACVLVLAALWKPTTNWSAGLAASKLETALLELRFPFHTISTKAKRAVLQARVEPFRVGQDAHLVYARGRAVTLWIDGNDVYRLIKPSPAPLVWSSLYRLWIGGRPDKPVVPTLIRRVAFFDRALDEDEVRRLAAAGPSAAIPPGLDPALVLDFVGASRGRLARPELVLPPDARAGPPGLALQTAPAHTQAALGDLVGLIRREQAFSVEIWWQPAAPLDVEDFPLLILGGEDGRRNLQIEAEPDELTVFVRAGYPALSRVADLLLNIAAFVPLGLVLLWGRTSLRSVGLAFAFGLALSLLIELTQVFRIDRISSLLDLAANSAGAALGGLIAVRWRRALDLLRR